MSTQPSPAGAPRTDQRRGLLVAGLVVAVVLLVGSVLATVAWAPRTFAGPGVPDERTWELGPGWYGGMGRMHDWMHDRMFDRWDGRQGSDNDLPPWWFDERESPAPTPSPTS